MDTEEYRERVKRAMFDRGWNQTDLVRESGVDKNTISAFLTGKTDRPATRTLAKIEDALGLTHGMLEESGEDIPANWRRLLESIPPTLLATALGRRVADMNETITDWHTPASRFQSLEFTLYSFAFDHVSDPGRIGEACRRFVEFDEIDAKRGTTPTEEAEFNELVIEIAALYWAHRPRARRSTRLSSVAPVLGE